MRGRLVAREAQGFAAKLASRTQRQRQNILAAMEELRAQEFELAIDLAPKDTTYMASQTQSQVTDRGYGYITGYRAEDFIGQINPVTGREIRTFYPPIVHGGTRFFAGNPWLLNTRRIMGPLVRARLAEALGG